MTLPKTAGTEELSKLLGINARTITKLVDKGILKRLRHVVFDLVDAVQSYVAYKEGLAEEKHEQGAMGQAQLELIREKITLLRMERETKAGQLIPAPDIIRFNVKFIQVCKHILLAIPSKHAPRLTNIKETSRIEMILRGAINEALESLQQLLNVAKSKVEKDETHGRVA
jgi:phage terminase Nu1 subunit (DNA packaging protein)